MAGWGYWPRRPAVDNVLFPPRCRRKRHIPEIVFLAFRPKTYVSLSRDMQFPVEECESVADFPSEESLVRAFLDHLCNDRTPWSAQLPVTREFYYLRGRADVVALSDGGEVVAFEAKLAKWKVAMHQAYRNTCFAHRSYIVMPRDAARRAATRISEFKRRGVGICAVGEDNVEILEEAQRSDPIQPWLSSQAAAEIEERRDVSQPESAISC